MCNIVHLLVPFCLTQGEEREPRDRGPGQLWGRGRGGHRRLGQEERGRRRRQGQPRPQVLPILQPARRRVSVFYVSF